MTLSPLSADRRMLKVLVGSHAQGLAGPEGDKHFRSVFVMPGADMFRMGFRYGRAIMAKEEARKEW